MSLDEQFAVLNGIGIILAFTIGLTTAKIMWKHNKIMAIIGVVPNFLFVAQALYYMAYQETLDKQQRRLFLFATFLTIPIWIAGAYYAFVSGANLGNVLAIRLMIIIVYLLIIFLSICIFDFERIKNLFSKVINSNNFYEILGFLLIAIIHLGSNMGKVDKFLDEVNIKYKEPKSEIDKFLAQSDSQIKSEIDEYMKDAPPQVITASTQRKSSYSNYLSFHNDHANDNSSNNEESYASKSYQYSQSPESTPTNYSSSNRENYRSGYSNSYSTNDTYGLNGNKKYDEPLSYNNQSSMTTAPPPSHITNCDSAGCWDNNGRRYNSTGNGQNFYSDSGKFCQNTGGQMECR